MGWKSLKDEYRIHHIVTADEQRVHIGHLKDFHLASIDLSTGAVLDDRSQAFLQSNYPKLAAASDEDRKTVLAQQDRFQRSLPVYSVAYGDIIQSACENYGYPNVTHEGKLLYPGAFTKDYREAVGWAKFDLTYDRNRKFHERNDHLDALANGKLKDSEESRDRTNRLEHELQELETKLHTLDRQHPTVQPIDPMDRDDLVVSMAPSP